MKSAISPDIWETKRMLITKLYKDEEWPLKQVIKLVQTPDFHPSESQLRSRLKKWHITKPSRKKYDGSRRLSGAKKNEQKRLSEAQSSLPGTFHGMQSHPILRTGQENDSSEVRSEASHASNPEISTSPAGQYVLPSSPAHEEPLFGPVMAPSPPITPAFYGMDDSKRGPNDASHTIYFCTPGVTSVPMTNTVPAPYPPQGPFGSCAELAELSPLSLVDHPGDYMGYPAPHFLPPHGKQQLMPPLLDGAQIVPWPLDYQTPSPTDVYPPSHSYFQEDYAQPLAPPIYQTM
ncbi:Clr5 domain-containing protein [Aspergillus lucknowensis]|uniref:Clr5 domain-containing protein n=1 Tax=Aspergillus lucknowensis TaxID=176173 RepID=A0ABR4L8W5_9EURO